MLTLLSNPIYNIYMDNTFRINSMTFAYVTSKRKTGDRLC